MVYKVVERMRSGDSDSPSMVAMSSLSMSSVPMVGTAKSLIASGGVYEDELS